MLGCFGLAFKFEHLLAMHASMKRALLVRKYSLVSITTRQLQQQQQQQ